MIQFTFSAHLHTARFSPDWSQVTETYSAPDIVLMSPIDRVSYADWGHIDGTGLFLAGPSGTTPLATEPLLVQRLSWNGHYTDVLWIDVHVRDSEGSVLGFDTYYIELGGTPLPGFASEQAFGEFLDAATRSTPAKGLFKDGRAFRFAEGMALERIEGEPTRDKLVGDFQDDLIFGKDGRDRLFGADGNDTLSGGKHNDLLDGGAGNDEMWGDGGHDTLSGGAGDDRLYGSRGEDVLDGGTGNDRLAGGIWADTFVFGPGHGTDRILDMNVAEGDRIRLSAALWTGSRTAFEVIEDFGDASLPDRVILRFDGGEVLHIIEAAPDALMGLHGAIDIL
jgi:hypothetical protein